MYIRTKEKAGCFHIPLCNYCKNSALASGLLASNLCRLFGVCRDGLRRPFRLTLGTSVSDVRLPAKARRKRRNNGFSEAQTRFGDADAAEWLGANLASVVAFVGFLPTENELFEFAIGVGDLHQLLALVVVHDNVEEVMLWRSRLLVARSFPLAHVNLLRGPSEPSCSCNGDSCFATLRNQNCVDFACVHWSILPV
ncbi:MAG: hypothetical protein RLZZ234_301 [Candidatus Parcubacteria bacterium]